MDENAFDKAHIHADKVWLGEVWRRRMNPFQYWGENWEMNWERAKWAEKSCGVSAGKLCRNIVTGIYSFGNYLMDEYITLPIGKITFGIDYVVRSIRVLNRGGRTKNLLRPKKWRV